MRKHLLISSVSLLVLTQFVKADIFPVTNEAQLIAAINSVNGLAGSHTINISNSITLTGAGLPAITNSVTINGGAGLSLTGNATSRLFVVGSDAALPPGATRPTVTINNLALNNGTAQGMNGTGGGGIGAGGAIYVARSGDVVINNVSFSGNRAIGGLGGAGAGGGAFGQGAGVNNLPAAGFGGSAGTPTAGGNGAAFGGAVMVMGGGTLSYGGNSTMTGGTLAMGSGALAAGSGIFIEGANSVRFTPGAGNTVTVNDTIADQTGLVMGGYAPPNSFVGNEIGQVVVSGAGTVALTGRNLYSGGTLVENGAVILASDNITNAERFTNLGHSSGVLTLNNGTLKASGNYSSSRNITAGGNSIIHNNGFTITQSGVISGPGLMRFEGVGAGQTNLTGANTFSGGIEVSNTRVGINSDSSLGQAGVPIALVSGGTIVALSNVAVNRTAQVGSDGLTFDTNGFNSSWRGVLSGPGAVNIAGGGNLSLLSNNDFTGGTNVAQGSTLTLGNGTTQGSILGNVVNNGTFAVNSNTPQTIANNVTGTGGTAINGTGVITVTGTIGSSGPVNINSGTLQLGDGGTTGTVTGPINIAPTGTLAVNHSNPLTLAQPITGTGTFTLIGPGTTTLTGATPFTGTTNINTGSTLQLGDGTTNGTLGGTLVNNGTLVLNNPTAQTVSANISGTGGVTQIGSGTTTLTGTTAYTGTTTITNGTLVVNGTLSGPVVSTGTGQIVVNGNAGGGIVSGGGNTTVNVGSTVTGGMTTVAPNILTVNGTVTGIANIVAGSTLMGAGTVGGAIIAGTLRPGATGGDIGQLNVNGNLTLAGSAISDFGITPTSNDQIRVSGATVLGGTMNVTAAAGTYSAGTRYTLVDAQGGRTGTYSAVNLTGQALGANILHRFEYKPKSFDLVLSSANITPYLANENDFVRRMGAGLDGQGVAGNRGVYNPLYDLAPNQVAKALKQFSGESVASGAAGLGRMSGQFMNAVSENGIRAGMMNSSGGGGGGSQPLPTLAPSAPAAMPVMRQASNSQTSDQPKTALAYVGETIVYVDEKGEKRKAVRGKKVIADKRKYIPLAQAGIIQNNQNLPNLGQFYVVQGQPVVSQNQQGLQPGQVYVVRGQNGQADQVYMVQGQNSGQSLQGQTIQNQNGATQVFGQANQTGMQTQNRRTQAFDQTNQQVQQQVQQSQSNGATQRFGGAQVSHNNGVDHSLTTASTGKSPRQPDSVIWGSLLGGGGVTQANAAAGTSAMSNQTYGLSGGVTYQPEHNFIVGAALSAVSISSTSGGGLGSTSGSGVQAAIYGRFNEGSLYIGNVFSFGGSWNKIDRTIAIGAFNQSLTGDTSAMAFGNRTEIGYRMGQGDFKYIPFAALAVSQVNQKGFSEKDNTGAVAGNIYSAFQQTAVRTELGMQFEKTFKTASKMPVSFKGQLAWGHLMSTKGSMSAVYAPIPTISFAVPMASPERDYLLAGVSTEWHLNSQMQAFLGLSGEFATGSTQMQARIGLKSAW